MHEIMAKSYGAVLLGIVVVIAVKHLKSPDPSERSQRVVAVLTVFSVFIFLIVPGLSIANALLQAGIGAYVLLHEMVTRWQREMDAVERAEQQVRAADRQGDPAINCNGMKPMYNGHHADCTAAAVRRSRPLGK